MKIIIVVKSSEKFVNIWFRKLWSEFFLISGRIEEDRALESFFREDICIDLHLFTNS